MSDEGLNKIPLSKPRSFSFPFHVKSEPIDLPAWTFNVAPVTCNGDNTGDGAALATNDDNFAGNKEETLHDVFSDDDGFEDEDTRDSLSEDDFNSSSINPECRCSKCGNDFQTESLFRLHKFTCSFSFQEKLSSAKDTRIDRTQEPSLVYTEDQPLQSLRDTTLQQRAVISTCSLPIDIQLQPAPLISHAENRQTARKQTVRQSVSNHHSLVKPQLYSKSDREFHDDVAFAKHKMIHNDLTPSAHSLRHTEVRNSRRNDQLSVTSRNSFSNWKRSNAGEYIRVREGFHLYKCPYCQKPFPSTLLVAKHCRDNHPDYVDKKCNYCGKVCRDVTGMLGHIRTHTGEMPFTCTLCGRNFCDAGNCKRHIGVVHLTKQTKQSISNVPQQVSTTFQCDSAKIPLAESPALLKTQESYVPLHPPFKFHKDILIREGYKYPCPYCGSFEFPLLASLKTHCEKAHPVQFRKRICIYCRKTFANVHVLVRHVRIHIGDQPFKCRYCHRTYSDVSGCKLHVKHHHCKSKVISRKTTERASGTSNTASVKIAFDGIAVTRMSPIVLITPIDLEKEMRILKGRICEQVSEKDPCIAVEPVDDAVNDKENDLSTKSGEFPNKERKKMKYPHTCTYCGKGFVTGIRLKKHMRLHTSMERMFVCQLCGYRFMTDKQLQAHVERHAKRQQFRSAISYPVALTADLTGLHQESDASIVNTGNEKEDGFLATSSKFPNKERKKVRYPHTCTYCGKGFVTGIRLKKHMRLHTSMERKFVCKLCGYRFMTDKQLQVHVGCHAKRQQFRSAISYPVGLTGDLIGMNEIHQESDASIVNTVLSEMVEQVHNELHPMEVELGESSKMADVSKAKTSVKHYTCNLCGKQWTCYKQFLKHLNIHNTRTTRWNSKRSKKITRGTNGLPNRGNYTYGISDPIVKKWKCLHCDTAFKYPSQLKRHMSIHCKKEVSPKISDPIVKNWKCLHCEAAFKYPSKLKRHMSIHCKKEVSPKISDPIVKNWKCLHCEAAFKYPSKLKRHMSIHCKKEVSPKTGTSNVKHSSLSFMVADSDKTSRKIECPKCGKKLSSKLQRHLDWFCPNAKKNQTIKCQFCEREYKSPSSFRQHKPFCEALWQSLESVKVQPEKNSSAQIQNEPSTTNVTSNFPSEISRGAVNNDNFCTKELETHTCERNPNIARRKDQSLDESKDPLEYKHEPELEIDLTHHIGLAHELKFEHELELENTVELEGQPKIELEIESKPELEYEQEYEYESGHEGGSIKISNKACCFQFNKSTNWKSPKSPTPPRSPVSLTSSPIVPTTASSKVLRKTCYSLCVFCGTKVIKAFMMNHLMKHYSGDSIHHEIPVALVNEMHEEKNSSDIQEGSDTSKLSDNTLNEAASISTSSQHKRHRSGSLDFSTEDPKRVCIENSEQEVPSNDYLRNKRRPIPKLTLKKIPSLDLSKFHTDDDKSWMRYQIKEQGPTYEESNRNDGDDSLLSESPQEISSTNTTPDYSDQDYVDSRSSSDDEESSGLTSDSEDGNNERRKIKPGYDSFDDPAERPYKCDVCGKRFRHNYLLTNHSYVHTGEKPFRCLYCNEKFREKTNARKHLKWWHMEQLKKDRLNKQVIEDEYDRSEMTYVQDILSSIGAVDTEFENQYKCEKCPRSFTKPSQLKEHLFVHSTQQLHACTVCGSKFKWKKTLVRHQRAGCFDEDTVVEGAYAEQSVKCKYCGKFLKCQYNLQRHLKNNCPAIDLIRKKSSKTYECMRCKKNFNKKYQLQKHQFSGCCADKHMATDSD